MVFFGRLDRWIVVMLLLSWPFILGRLGLFYEGSPVVTALSWFAAGFAWLGLNGTDFFMLYGLVLLIAVIWATNKPLRIGDEKDPVQGIGAFRGSGGGGFDGGGDSGG